MFEYICFRGTWRKMFAVLSYYKRVNAHRIKLREGLTRFWRAVLVYKYSDSADVSVASCSDFRLLAQSDLFCRGARPDRGLLAPVPARGALGVAERWRGEQREGYVSEPRRILTFNPKSGVVLENVWRVIVHACFPLKQVHVWLHSDSKMQANVSCQSWQYMYFVCSHQSCRLVVEFLRPRVVKNIHGKNIRLYLRLYRRCMWKPL